MFLFRRPSRLTGGLWLAFLSLVFVTLVVLLVRTLYQGFASTGSPMAARAPQRLANTDVNPYGANFFLAREVEPWKLDKTLHMASDAGIGWVKQQFAWESIEPLRKGEFLEPTAKTDSWTKYDQIVAACEKYGLRIVARLDRPPDWTRQDNTYKERPPDDYEDYGDFVYAFVKHYEGRIDYIQIWNEPNIFPEWGNQAVDPAAYVDLLKVAYRRAKEANPNVTVLSAPLAITLGQAHPEPNKWIAMDDLSFLEGMYASGAADYFDIYSANAFGMDLPPEDPPAPETLNFQRVLLQREIMERYGDSDKAVWFNEYGWNAAPESFPADRLVWKRVTEKQQADYTLQGIKMAQEEWPWAGVFMIWYFRQVGNISPERSDYYFRMVDPDFTPRPLYFAVQDVAGGQDAVLPGVYEETNPNVKTHGHWRNVIDKWASGQAYIRSEVKGDSVTFTFTGPGIDLITRKGPGAGRFLVALDGRSVPGLSTNAQGATYVDLYDPTLRDRARVPLVRNAGSREHTLRLTVDGDRHEGATGSACTLDAFVIVVKEDRAFPVIPLVAILLGLAFDTWLLWHDWRRLRWVIRAP